MISVHEDHLCRTYIILCIVLCTYTVTCLLCASAVLVMLWIYTCVRKTKLDFVPFKFFVPEMEMCCSRWLVLSVTVRLTCLSSVTTIRSSP